MANPTPNIYSPKMSEKLSFLLIDAKSSTIEKMCPKIATQSTPNIPHFFRPMYLISHNIWDMLDKRP